MQAVQGKAGVWPERFVDLKKQIAAGNEEVMKRSWNEVIEALAERTKEIAKAGPEYIPQVEFSELSSLSKDEVARIRRIGSVVIRNIVDDDVALGYKEALKEYVKANPQVDGFPEGNKQFFEMYWSPSQLKARSHPNVLAAGAWVNNLWDASEDDVVDLDHCMSYADRFRIRQPSPNKWGHHSPHIDGGATERWEDPTLRSSFADIFNGNWQSYNPWAISGRLNATTDLYRRPNQTSIFRTLQGWLAMSDTGPGEGTIRFFPDLVLSNTYVMLRPFFKPVNPDLTDEALLDPSNWVFDTSDPSIPGIKVSAAGNFSGVQPANATHPHLKLDEAVVSVPRVKPGDMVFWHCDVIHSVEDMHTGPSDSSVMYIGATPLSPHNVRYLVGHRDNFLKRIPPPDFPQGNGLGESQFVGHGQESDMTPEGLVAMGLRPFTAKEGATRGAMEAVKDANAILGLA